MERSERPRWDEDARSAVRVYGGWLVALVGGLLCAVGWYGASGEKYEARQIPYLASATLPGAALIVAGAVLIAARMRTGDRELRQRVAELHAFLVDPGEVPGADGGPVPVAAATEAAATEEGEATWLAVPGGARYHRPGCGLVAGKPAAYPVDRAAVAEQGLRPCPLCDPDAGDGAAGAPRDLAF